MNPFLNKLFGIVRKSSPPPVPTRRVQPTPPVPPPNEYPPTFGTPPTVRDEENNLIFDPATRHFARAFRRGDPMLPDVEMKRWHAARRQVMHHLLNLVTHSQWAEHFVLRGSLALKAGLGADAREPGDIDWVLQPTSVLMNSVEARRMMDGIVMEVARNARIGDIEMDIAAIARNDIWTYERAAGHRIAFPWQCAELPAAVMQMDFVFEQSLFTQPIVASILLEDLPEIKVQTASDEESLAWKLLWLYTDEFPQGKDLYDATLLAEQTPLSTSVLRSVLLDAEHTNFPNRFPLAAIDDLYNLDWENFLKECPWVQGLRDRWIARLQFAIKDTVEELRAGWGNA